MTRSLANLRKVNLRELAHTCPEAGSGPRTRQPTARLDRWKILQVLLLDSWPNPGIDEADLLERHLGALSRLEADLIRRMYLNVRRILPLDDDVTLGNEGAEVHHDFLDHGVSTSVRFTITLDHPDGSTEHIRLKTGRSTTSAEEAAVVWASAEDGESFFDLMAWPGELEEISRPPDPEARLAALIESSPAIHRSGVRPGPACVWCARAATCGAFPAAAVVPSTARSLNLTKTDVEQARQCHRRVAWRRVHGIPRDDGDDVDLVPRLSQGRLFHGLVQMAEGAEDPDAAIAAYLNGVPPSEVADLEVMWENHRRMMEEEGLTVRMTEFPVGSTLTLGERAEMKATTLIGFIDLTARDPAGQPVAVELKTGGQGDTGIEDDLYAVGMRRWVESDRPIVIHRHLVRLGECHVVTYDDAAVDLAARRLADMVQSVHHWDWEDPLQPAFTTGPWCVGCEYRATCESYR